MKKIKTKGFVLFLLAFTISAAQNPVKVEVAKNKGDQKVRYSKSKKLDFESLLIEGQLKRPEISVVTGNSGGDDSGLLRLREDFSDQMAMEAGEEIR